MRRLAAALLAAAAACTTAGAEYTPHSHLIPGSFEPNRGPDGNSIFLEAPEGLILIDTGRHPEHRDKLLAHARERGRPIIAVVNTHWHLDHSTGNADVLAAHPGAERITSTAIEGALTGFLASSREQAEAQIVAGTVPPERAAEFRRFLDVMDNPGPLRPTRPVTTSGEMVIGGRSLQVNLARHAATEGDVWIIDPATDTAFVGDLVVTIVPFMDTACPDGWRSALDQVAAAKWTKLVPGHGAPMSRAAFEQWRTAFNNLIHCADSNQGIESCVSGWRRDAAPFVAGESPERVDGMTRYYLETRLRSPEGRRQYCGTSPQS